MAERIWFVIAAAGRATRFGGPVPKPYLRIAGATLLEHCLRAFAALPGLAGGAVVLATGDRRYERIADRSFAVAWSRSKAARRARGRC